MTAEVLLVDDDRSLGETLQIGLKKHGIPTSWHESAAGALQALDSGTFDVVVTDLNMKQMGGIELCERVAQNRPDVPVIMITAYGDAETRRKAIERGAEGLLTKPIDFAALRLEIDSRLGQAA